MIYPEFLKSSDTIGVTATSDGNGKEVDIRRLENGKRKLEDRGYHLIETANVRTSLKGRSSSGQDRAKQFMELIENPEVKYIVAAKGGDYLMEMLPDLDYEHIRKHPKWVQGFSDTTGITFTITTLCDIATVYGNNFNDFSMEPWHSSLEKNLSLLEGEEILQTSFEYFEDQFSEKVTGYEGYLETAAVKWKSAGLEEQIEMEGRLLGGCLDVLLNLVGTRFDHVGKFIEKYKKDGIVWYLESFDLSSEALIRGLWQLREAGWFQYAKGFVFGRPCMFSTETETSYEEAVLSVLKTLNVPIILDADIGHRPPQFTIVNGAYGKWFYENGKGSLSLIF